MADNTPPTFVFPKPAASSNRPVVGQNITSWQNRLPGDHIPPSFGPLAPPKTKSRAGVNGGGKNTDGVSVPLDRAASSPDILYSTATGVEFDSGPSHSPSSSAIPASKPTSTQALTALAGRQEQLIHSVERYCGVTNDVMGKLAHEVHDVCDRFAETVVTVSEVHGNVPKILDNTNTVVDNQFKYFDEFKDMMSDVSGMATSLRDMGADVRDAARDLGDMASDLRTVTHDLRDMAADMRDTFRDWRDTGFSADEPSASPVVVVSSATDSGAVDGLPTLPLGGDAVPFAVPIPGSQSVTGQKRAHVETPGLLARMSDGPVKKKHRRNKLSAVMRGKMRESTPPAPSGMNRE